MNNEASRQVSSLNSARNPHCVLISMDSRVFVASLTFRLAARRSARLAGLTRVKAFSTLGRRDGRSGSSQGWQVHQEARLSAGDPRDLRAVLCKEQKNRSTPKSRDPSLYGCVPAQRESVRLPPRQQVPPRHPIQGPTTHRVHPHAPAGECECIEPRSDPRGVPPERARRGFHARQGRSTIPRRFKDGEPPRARRTRREFHSGRGQSSVQIRDDSAARSGFGVSILRGLCALCGSMSLDGLALCRCSGWQPSLISACSMLRDLCALCGSRSSDCLVHRCPRRASGQVSLRRLLNPLLSA